MITDPIRDVENPAYRIMRGSSIFTSRFDLHDCGSGSVWREHAWRPSTWYLGFRISLTLPCNVGGSVV